MAYIAEHAWPARSYDTTRLRLDEVAHAVGVSRRHLQRLLREVGDTTFGEALQAASMQRAEHVLLSGNEPVSEIVSPRTRDAGALQSGALEAVAGGRAAGLERDVVPGRCPCPEARCLRGTALAPRARPGRHDVAVRAVGVALGGVGQRCRPCVGGNQRF